MNDIAILQSLANKSTEDLELIMLVEEQVECPVVHHFGPGIYIRELSMKAGTLAIGHRQKFDHVNIVLKGKVAVLGDNGQVNIIEAPMMFVGKPGRKIGMVLEDLVWQNVYATELTDVDEIETHFLDKSMNWTDIDKARIGQFVTIEDRLDFEAMLEEYGLDPEIVRAQSISCEDQRIMPYGSWKFKKDSSPIEGVGIFATMPIDISECIGPARIGGLRTPLGRFTNHSKFPNSEFVVRNNGDIDLVAMQKITGCSGGSNGEEITVNYRQSLKLSGVVPKEKS